MVGTDSHTSCPGGRSWAWALAGGKEDEQRKTVPLALGEGAKCCQPETVAEEVEARDLLPVRGECSAPEASSSLRAQLWVTGWLLPSPLGPARVVPNPGQVQSSQGWGGFLWLLPTQSPGQHLKEDPLLRGLSLTCDLP